MHFTAGVCSCSLIPSYPISRQTGFRTELQFRSSREAGWRPRLPGFLRACGVSKLHPCSADGILRHHSDLARTAQAQGALFGAADGVGRGGSVEVSLVAVQPWSIHRRGADWVLSVPDADRGIRRTIGQDVLAEIVIPQEDILVLTLPARVTPGEPHQRESHGRPGKVSKG